MRILFPTLAALIAAAGADLAVADSQTAAKPNIVFIMADDLGYGDLGCYGQARIQTPRLDRLAAEGLRFTDAYAGSTVCAPSRSAIMTGHHTGNTPIRDNHSRGERVALGPEDVTVAEVLQGAGYRTGLVGKWGLGEPETTGIPNRQGFDYFFGYLNQRHAHNFYPEYLWRNEERVPLEGNEEAAPDAHGTKGQYAPELLTREALEFVERNQDGPFFLYWAKIRPHAANQASRHYGPETGEGMPVPTDAPYSDEDWPQPQKNHAAMITQLDADVGKLLDLLDSLGIAENTLVIFGSDNGPHREGGAEPDFFDSSGPLRGIKRDLYEGGIRVPTIASWPGTIAPGTDRTVWAYWDLFPTFAELAGAAVPEGLDGVSLARLFREGQRPFETRPPLYWEFHGGGFSQAVRDGDWKLVRNSPDSAPELYNLAEDLGETRDLAAEYPEKTAELTRLLTDLRTPSPHWPVPGL